jgi:hypothetical protein
MMSVARKKMVLRSETDQPNSIKVRKF